MYKIKQIPEDFIVREILDIPFEVEGKFVIYELKKKDYTTQKAVDTIQKALYIRDVKYAGLKDRQAVTYQYISVPKKYSRIKKFEHELIELKPVGYLNEPLSLGKNKGNNFEIVVRNLDTCPKNIEYFKNLYGEQRFSKSNFEAGLAIIKGDFKKAIDYISDKSVDNQYKINHSDPVRAIRKLPKKIISLLVHSVQSKIFNELVLSRDFEKNEVLPLVGFDFSDNEKYYKDIKILLDKYGIKPRDFIIKSIPDATCETSYRSAYSSVKNQKIGELQKDEINNGKKKIKIIFELDKGSYATVAISNMFE
jgi:tRNA pseudouridine13 synthase